MEDYTKALNTVQEIFCFQAYFQLIVFTLAFLL